MISFGNAVRRLRKSQGLSQRELAKLLAVTPSYISHLEADRREPSVELLRRLAKQLKVPPGLLLATALLVEVPPEDRVTYQNAAAKLLELAMLSQRSLWDPHEGETEQS